MKSGFREILGGGEFSATVASHVRTASDGEPMQPSDVRRYRPLMNPDLPQHRASIAGKPIVVVGKDGDRPSTLDEVRDHLRRQPTFALLQALGTLACHTESAENIPVIDNIPVTMHAIACLAFLAVESSNDFRSSKRGIDQAYMARLFDLFWHLPDPIRAGSLDSVNEFLVRMGDHQFIYQSELRHQLPRMVLILRDIWPTVPKASGVSPLAAFKSATGLEWQDAVLLGVLCTAQSQPTGVIDPAKLLASDADTNETVRRVFTKENWDLFCRWVSADYETIRSTGRNAAPPSPEYIQYRFNPLRLFPLIRPALVMGPHPRDAVLLPVWRLLFERTTIGVYHTLSDLHNAGGGSNPFRNAFGHVFQEYVGRIMKESLAGVTVIPEWQYDSATAKNVDSPDWIVVHPDGAVVVEVKQSSMFREARQWGDVASMRDDLKKTLVKAMQQLARFQEAINHSMKGTERLHGLPLQLAVVSFDRIHFGNTVIRDALAEVVAAQGGTVPRIHVISVEEFEYLLGACTEDSLFALLKRKQEAESEDRLDFREWLTTTMKGKVIHSNSFLSAQYNQFYESYGFPPAEPLQ